MYSSDPTLDLFLNGALFLCAEAEWTINEYNILILSLLFKCSWFDLNENSASI